MPELNGKSLDILEENIKSLRQLFLEVKCKTYDIEVGGL